MCARRYCLDLKTSIHLWDNPTEGYQRGCVCFGFPANHASNSHWFTATWSSTLSTPQHPLERIRVYHVAMSRYYELLDPRFCPSSTKFIWPIINSHRNLRNVFQESRFCSISGPLPRVLPSSFEGPSFRYFRSR